MKATVELPDDLLIAAKKRAAELRRPLRVIIEELWTHDSGFVTMPGLCVRDPLS